MIVSRTLYLPKVKFFLVALDAIAVAASLLLSAVVRFGWTRGLEFLGVHAGKFLLIWVAFPVMFYLFGLYENTRLEPLKQTLTNVAASVFATSLLVCAAAYASFSVPFGRGIIVLFALLVFVTIASLRLLRTEAVRLGLGHRCLVIGTGVEARKAIALVGDHPNAGLKIIGIIDCGKNGSPSRVRDYDVLGGLEDLDKIVGSHDIDRLIVAGAAEDEPALLRQLRPFRYRGMGIIDFISLHEELGHQIPVDHIDDEWLFIAATRNSHFHIHRIKRVMDVAAALVILFPLGLIALAVASLCIKFTSKGPILFRQERVGLESRPFMLLKLRTMRQDAEKLTGPMWSTDDDPRVTSVGRILRKFRIDELPQLFNVLRGDMSLIGPRPERDCFVRKLSQTLPFYRERLMVRPGVTGWAQVMAPYAASVEDTRIKLQFDLYYIKHMSLFLDLLIVAKTVKTVLFGREREQGGIATSAVEPVPLRASTLVGATAGATTEIDRVDIARKQAG